MQVALLATGRRDRLGVINFRRDLLQDNGPLSRATLSSVGGARNFGGSDVIQSTRAAGIGGGQNLETRQ
jgi:hypothetical protein